MKLKINKDSFEFDARVCSELEKAKGLMFVRREKAEALIFSFPREARLAIHSLFVFFPFLAVWLDDRGKVVFMKTVKPFCFSVCPQKPFSTLIEIPINEKYKKIAEEISSIKEKNPVDKKI